MTTEQKAKAYDEAYKKVAVRFGSNVAEEIFSEYEESEDERIRKWLVEMVEELRKANPTNADYNGNCSNAIAWLEKQGEQKPVDKVEPKFHEGDIIIHKELGGDYIHNPHKIIQVDILDKKYRLEGGLVAHFGEQEDYELLEQKPAWSEEDDVKINRIVACLENLNVADNDILLKDVAWLKSLKDRAQQNKLKESHATADLENSLCNIQDGLPDTSYEYRTLGEAIEFIRCTEPKPQWKPSDEQIKVCKEVYADILSAKGFDLGTVNSELNRMEEELKKLREE